MQKISSNGVVSRQDCAQILDRCFGKGVTAVIDYEVKPFSNEVNGFMGDHLLIYITYTYLQDDSVKKTSFFAKRFPFEQELQRQYALSIGAFGNEITTYDVIFEEYKKWKGFDEEMAPKYYFGKDNDILVFEDLSCRGFVVPKNPNSLSLDHIKFGLDVLAKYHAGGIGYQEMKSNQLGRKYRLVEDYPRVMQEPLFRQDPNHLANHWFRARISGLKAVVDMLPEDEELDKDTFKAGIDDLGKQAMKILEPNENYYNVLCHGDMWAKNLLFRYINDKPVDCKLIDFQLQRYTQPVHDVLQFIYLAINTSGRQHHLHHLLKYYHDRLTTELKRGDLDINNILLYEDLEASVSYVLPQMKLQTSFYLTFQGANQEFHKKVTSNPALFKKWVFGDGGPFNKELYQTDQNFRNLMIDTFKELKYQILYPRVSLEDCFKIVQTSLQTTDYKFIDYSYKLNELNIVIEQNSKRVVFDLVSKFNCENELEFSKEIFVTKTLFQLMLKNGIDDIRDCMPHYHIMRPKDVLVRDNLKTKHFRFVNRLNYDEILIVFEKLAKFHSSAIVLEEKLSKNEQPFRLGDHFKNELKEYVVNKNEIIQQFPQLNNLIFDKVSIKETIFRRVVCYGNFIPNLLSIKYTEDKPTDCLITDYRSLRYDSPARDIINLLYATTDRFFRTQHKSNLVRFYYQKFSEILEKHNIKVESIGSLETFLMSCDVVQESAIWNALDYYSKLSQTGDENVQNMVKQLIEDLEKICGQNLIL